MCCERVAHDIAADDNVSTAFKKGAMVERKDMGVGVGISDVTPLMMDSFGTLQDGGEVDTSTERARAMTSLSVGGIPDVDSFPSLLILTPCPAAWKHGRCILLAIAAMHTSMCVSIEASSVESISLPEKSTRWESIQFPYDLV